jgi:hypothetical protein
MGRCCTVFTLFEPREDKSFFVRGSPVLLCLIFAVEVPVRTDFCLGERELVKTNPTVVNYKV